MSPNRTHAVNGHTVLVVDDGVATGSSARAACQIARAQGAVHVIMAVPVAPVDWQTHLGDAADEYVCLETPESFFSIGQFYEDFAQSTDEEVVSLLERAARRSANSSAPPRDDEPTWRDEEVEVDAAGVRLAGHLSVTRGASAIVIFAHGSGSSRRSPRNRLVANVLNQAGLATLLFDLLTIEEELDRSNVFDISLLAQRLVDVTRWLHSQPDLARLRVGYFGASTSAGAALWAASEPGIDVAAVVSRGGRPDLAGPRLAHVSAPTLLIVGAEDQTVLALNRKAQAHLHCETKLVVVPTATHLFEEPGTLQIAAEAARDWFVTHLAPVSRP
ncbi:MAG: phosphoribosyltransferase [Acidobacteria bacterium]|nr:phosphoribosyltransferase [Acidobacteriota bacterium]